MDSSNNINRGKQDAQRSKKRILIVEDEPLVSWSLTNVLNDLGFQTTVVLSGGKAIEKIYSSQFDLVITDLKLPQINGFEVASAVRTFAPQTPIILISAVEDQICREFLVQQGIDGFLEKPFNLREMTALISKFT
ncbi:MAG: response regulator [Ignavibacteriae bacterium]|nr:response regulator [Ignavibacteriota bacterium]